MIENFDAAVENVSAPECKLVERFTEDLGWRYFDLDAVQA
jgi:hypothetical protein